MRSAAELRRNEVGGVIGERAMNRRGGVGDGRRVRRLEEGE